MRASSAAQACLTVIFAFISLCGCSSSSTRDGCGDAVPVILDTDVGTDIDDALAMDLLYKYADEGKADILGVCLTKDDAASVEYVDVLNTWYGYPDVKIGVAGSGEFGSSDVIYAPVIDTMTNSDGRPFFMRSVKDYSSLPQAVTLYREMLSSTRDSSVVIISTGFLTNLARLLESGSDSSSPLTGAELVKRKVKSLVVMGGCFSDSTHAECNVVMDIPSSQRVFHEWPTPIVVSPFEVGAAVCYPAVSIENDFGWTDRHPVVDAYKIYHQMPYDRPMWDPTAVLYAVEGGGWFNVSDEGTITVNDKGVTFFTPCKGALRRYLSISQPQADSVKLHLVKLISAKPSSITLP